MLLPSRACSKWPALRRIVKFQSYRTLIFIPHGHDSRVKARFHCIEIIIFIISLNFRRNLESVHSWLFFSWLILLDLISWKYTERNITSNTMTSIATTTTTTNYTATSTTGTFIATTIAITTQYYYYSCWWWLQNSNSPR